MQKQRKVIIGLALAVSVIFCLFVVWPTAGWFLLSIFFGEWSAAEIRFSVTSTADDRPIIAFDQGSIDYRRHPFLAINVHEMSTLEPNYLDTQWSISQALEKAAAKQKLSSITYGICPPGFEEVSRPKPLVSGHYYMIEPAISWVIKKEAPCEYQVISYDDYRKSVENSPRK